MKKSDLMIRKTTFEDIQLYKNISRNFIRDLALKIFSLSEII